MKLSLPNNSFENFIERHMWEFCVRKVGYDLINKTPSISWYDRNNFTIPTLIQQYKYHCKSKLKYNMLFNMAHGKHDK